MKRLRTVSGLSLQNFENAVVRHRLLDAVSKQKGEIGSYKGTY
jgi:hypothetical protein